MKRVCVWLGVLLLFWCICASAHAQSAALEDGIRDAVRDADISAWDAAVGALPEGLRGLWDGENVSRVIEDYASGTRKADLSGVFKALGGLLDDQWRPMLLTVLRLLGVSLLSGLVHALANGSMEGMHEIAGFACHVFAVLIAVTVFAETITQAGKGMRTLSDFIEMSFPTLMTLLTATGGIAASGAFQPAMAVLCSGVTFVLKDVVIPIVLAGGVIAIVNHMTGRAQLGQLFGLSKSVAKWVIGITFTLYTAFTVLQGMTAAAFDGVSVRMAKYAVDKFVPVVGGMVSGTVDMVIGSGILVKNAAGMTAVILAACIVATPLIRIGVTVFAFRIAAALGEPVADPRLPKLFASLAEVLTFVFAAVVALAAMFMITAGLITGAGNAEVMVG